eukprot:TRINITY_DN27253_c0_g1_i1.p1 TRINITY_DN27253_c0_g1~~TRINITY_DN27253_c0_g1_i1.p1  ORF type:complete len:1556 (+),score=270.66 TRINITY_DN27253_c0_g1_i1:597-4670(+)
MQLGIRWALLGDPMFDVNRITPSYRSGTQSIRYPMMSWHEANCLQQYLRSSDGKAYGYHLNGQCQECSHSSVQTWNGTAGRKNCKICGNGTQQVDDQCQECPRGFSLFRAASERDAEATSHECESCSAGKYQKAPGQSSCDECEGGRFSSSIASTQCIDCQEVSKRNKNHPYFSWPGNDRCIPCPPGAICEANEHGLFDGYTNQAGYFLFEGTDLQLHATRTEGDAAYQPKNAPSRVLRKCVHGRKGEACQSHRRCYRDKSGVITMEGPVCGACKPGCAKAGDDLSLCKPCPSLTWSITAVIMNCLCLFLQAGLLFMICSSIDFTRRETIFWPLIKQLFSYLHMSAVVFNLSGEHGLYGFDAGLLFGWLYNVLGLSGNVMLSDATCIAWHVVPDMPIAQFWTLLGLLWIPLMLIGLVALFHIRVILRFLRRSEDLYHGYEYSVMWFGISMYLYFPTISGLMLTTWNCEKFDVYRVLVDTKVECYSQGNMAWRIVGGAGILVFSVGIPMALIALLRHFYAKDRLQETSVARMFGFLYSGFEPRYYYFESFYMIRKLLFQIIPVAGWFKGKDADSTGRLQNSGAALLASIGFTFHLAFTPYDNRGYFILDSIEQASLQAVIITAFVQLWALDTQDALEDWDPTYKSISSTFLSLVVIWAHLRFWLMATWGIVRKLVRGLWGLYTSRFQHLQSGWLKVCPNGLIMESMGTREELLLTTMFQELVDFQILTAHKVDFDVLLGGFQSIVVRAHRERLLAKVARLDKVSHRFARARELVDALLSSSPSKYAHMLLNNLEKVFGVDKDVKIVDKINAMKDAAKSLEDFSPKNVARTIGQKFSVEELHASMMLLGSDVAQHSRKIGIAKRAEIHGYHIESIILTGARGGGKKKGSASDLNGDWVPHGLRNDRRVYKMEPDGVVHFEKEDGQGAKTLGTFGKPKWTIFINGHYRYFNEADSVEVPSTGWTANPGFARGSLKICPGLNDPNDDRRVESVNITGARGGTDKTGHASDLNGDWAPAELHHGCRSYRIHQDGILCFEEEDSKAGRHLGTPGKSKWTMFIHGHYRYYNEQDSPDVPPSGWIAVDNYAKGTPRIRPCFYDPDEDPALRYRKDERDAVQLATIRQLREELEHANRQIARLSRHIGKQDNANTAFVLGKSETVLNAGNTSHASLPAVLEAPKAATTSFLLGDTETPTLRSDAETPTQSHTVLEINDGEVSEPTEEATQRSDDKDKQISQVKNELKAASLKAELLEEALSQERELVAKWQMRANEEQDKNRRLKNQLEATTKEAAEEMQAANELHLQTQKALRDLEHELNLERQKKCAVSEEEAQNQKRQQQLEAAKEAAKNHLMSSSFVAPARI